MVLYGYFTLYGRALGSARSESLKIMFWCLRITRPLSRCLISQRPSLQHFQSFAIPHCESRLFRLDYIGIQKRATLPFSSRAPLLYPAEDVKSEEKPQKAKRKTRSTAAKNSLRRVAVEAQRSRDGKEAAKPSTAVPSQATPQVISSAQNVERWTNMYHHTRR